MSWIAYALIVIIVPIVLGMFTKSARVPAERVAGKAWLGYGKWFKGLSTVSLFLPGIGVLAIMQAESSREVMVAYSLFCFFLIIVFSMLLEAFFVRIAFDEKSIYCMSPWRKAREIPISELGKPTFNTSMQWWVIPAGEHGNVRVPTLLHGWEDLINCIEPDYKTMVEELN